MLATDSAPLSPAPRVSFLPLPAQSLGVGRWGGGAEGALGCFAEPPQYMRCTGKTAVLIAPLWTELLQKRSEMQCQ